MAGASVTQKRKTGIIKKQVKVCAMALSILRKKIGIEKQIDDFLDQISESGLQFEKGMDAYLKGNIQEKDVEVLLEAVLKNANIDEGRPMTSVGRVGVDYYNTLGFVPYNVGINENAARTLEYAFADFTIARMTQKLGKKELADTYFKRSLNYKNLFDPSTNLMRGKNEDGSFQTQFNPLKWGDAFTEGNS